MTFYVAGFPVLYVLATTVLVIILVRIVMRRPTNLPPGPTGLPLLGSLHLLSPLPHQSLAVLAKKYGPLMSLRLGQTQCIVASSPATAMEFLRKQDANFCARAPLRSGQVLFGPDIFCQNNSPIWRLLRKIFHTELTGTKRIEATHHVREEEMAHLLRTLPRNQEFELTLHLGVLFSNIISRLVLNRRFCAPVEGHEESTEEQMLEIQNFREIMEAIHRCLSAFYPADFISALKWFDFQGLDRLFKDTRERMDAFAAKIILEHQEQRQRGPVAEHEKDMVHILLDEMDLNGTDKSGPQMTMANVKGIMWVRRYVQLISDHHLLLRCNSVEPSMTRSETNVFSRRKLRRFCAWPGSHSDTSAARVRQVENNPFLEIVDRFDDLCDDEFHRGVVCSSATSPMALEESPGDPCQPPCSSSG